MVEQTAVTGVKTPARAWAVLVVVYIASFMAPMAQFKVPPLASWLIPTFAMDGASFGMMMSALSIIGLILAFPAGWIIQKLNLKNAMIISVACLAIGTLIGALSTSYGMMFASRMIEGIGIGLIGVAAPACVSIWFPDKTRGTALGIWASWFPLGMALMFNIAPAIAGAFDWQAVYWFSVVFDVIALILFIVVFKMPEGAHVQQDQSSKFTESLKYLKNSKLWLLALSFFIFNFVQLGVINTFYNTFLEMNGLDPQAAGSITSVMSIFGIFLGPLSGIIFDRVPYRHRHWLMLLCYVFFAIGFLFAWWSGDGMMIGVWTFIILCGIGAGVGAGTLRPYAPTLVPETAMGATMAMTLLQFMQNAGAAVGAPIFGAAFESIGWVNTNWFLIPLCILAVIFILLLKPKKTIAAERATDVAKEEE